MSIQVKTNAEWVDLNPVIINGEVVFDSTASLFKVGDGVTEWVNLPYTLRVRAVQDGDDVTLVESPPATKGTLLPAGTTEQRPSPLLGYIRYNTTIDSFEGYNDVGWNRFCKPFDNKFIVQGTADAELTGAQFLGSLSTGLLKNTTTSGVLSIASPSSDYMAYDGDLQAIADLAGTSGFLKKTAANTWTLDTTTYQTQDGDLDAIAALAGTSGFLKKTAANTWSLDTTSYQTLNTDLTAITGVTGNIGLLKKNSSGSWEINTDLQVIIDLSGSSGFLKKLNDGATFSASMSGGTMSVSNVSSGTLAVGQYIRGTGVNGSTIITGLGTGSGGTGTYSISPSQSLTGRTMYASQSWGLDTSSSYQASDADLTAIAALSGTSGYLKKTAANTWALDTDGSFGKVTVSSGSLYVQGSGTWPSSGYGIEIISNTSTATDTIQAYNRGTSAWRSIVYGAASHTWNISGSFGAILDSSGKLAIGTNEPYYRINAIETGNPSQGLMLLLWNKGSSHTGCQIHFAQQSGGDWCIGQPSATDAFAFYRNRYSGSNGTEVARFNSGGELLIGYTSDNGAYLLQVNSQIFATSSTIATSDGNFKTNILSLDSGSLDLICKLNPISFNWKPHSVHNFTSETRTGFIAQEVLEVLRDTEYKDSIVVSNKTELPNGKTEEFLGMSETGLIPLLVKSIQVLNNRTKELEDKLNEQLILIDKLLKN